jgi:hypothetical protein
MNLIGHVECVTLPSLFSKKYVVAVILSQFKQGGRRSKYMNKHHHFIYEKGRNGTTWEHKSKYW